MELLSVVGGLTAHSHSIMDTRGGHASYKHPIMHTTSRGDPRRLELQSKHSAYAQSLIHDVCSMPTYIPERCDSVFLVWGVGGGGAPPSMRAPHRAHISKTHSYREQHKTHHEHSHTGHTRATHTRTRARLEHSSKQGCIHTDMIYVLLMCWWTSMAPSSGLSHSPTLHLHHVPITHRSPTNVILHCGCRCHPSGPLDRTLPPFTLYSCCVCAVHPWHFPSSSRSSFSSCELTTFAHPFQCLT